MPASLMVLSMVLPVPNGYLGLLNGYKYFGDSTDGL